MFEFDRILCPVRRWKATSASHAAWRHASVVKSR